MRSILNRLCLVAFALLGVNAACAASIVVERSVGEARIERVAGLPAADLVLLDSGFHAGLREGMICTVSRGGETIGELLLVDLRPRAASALILDIAQGASLQSGDHVAVKTVSSRK